MKMRKLQDRFLLGGLAGVVGNIPKVVLQKACVHRHIAEISGVERAAGMLVPAHQTMTFKGQVIGSIADFIIAGMLGVVAVHALSISGTNKAILKGALTGQVAWTALYGVAGTMGATRIKTVSPNTVISELIGHTIYGAVVGVVAIALGNPKLFNGEIPLFASTTKGQGTIMRKLADMVH